MNEDLRQSGSTPRPDLPPNALSEINDTRPNGETPTLITEAELCVIEGKRIDVRCICAIPDEATIGMGPESNEEEERQMMRVPERFETLLADLVMSGGVHENHAE